MRFTRIIPLIMLIAAAALPAQSNVDDEAAFPDENWPVTRGDLVIAEKYLLWAQDAIAEDRWPQARAALERAADFADISSDISYLLALARSHENESRWSVLESLQRAIGTGRWEHYTEADARLVEADQLICLRRYDAALDTLAVYRDINGDTADAVVLRLAALKGLINRNQGLEPQPAPNELSVVTEFCRRFLETIDTYPRDPRPLRILFDYAYLRKLNHDDTLLDLAIIDDAVLDDAVLLETALRRLPFLLEKDQELAWMAAPFINDTAEARRLIAAYRAGSLLSRQHPDFKPHPASIMHALNLGLIDDRGAADELFTETIIDREHITAIAQLLRGEEGRSYFTQKLHAFTGAITHNEDRDEHTESRAMYHQGNLQEYYYDIDQDGVNDMLIVFNAGTPLQAELTTPLLRESGAAPMLITWERYPLVKRAALGDETYLFAPGGFSFAPLVFEELGGSEKYAGLLFTRHNFQGQSINRRIIASSAASVQRSSAEFPGGVEQIILSRGVPVHAEVAYNNTIVSVTEFENGYPIVQRLDMDMDGRLETVRTFDQSVIRAAASDWYGGDIFSSSELYRDDGSVVYSWDLNGDGTREYTERR